MIDLPFKPSFDELPDIDPEQFVEYFNLEFGISPDNPNEKPFIATDFSYIGVHEVNGIQTMFWSVAGQDICATIQPYEDSYMIGMDRLSGESNDS
ncbi:hypothetical protein [Porticoccus sp.]